MDKLAPFTTNYRSSVQTVRSVEVGDRLTNTHKPSEHPMREGVVAEIERFAGGMVLTMTDGQRWCVHPSDLFTVDQPL